MLAPLAKLMACFVLKGLQKKQKMKAKLASHWTRQDDQFSPDLSWQIYVFLWEICCNDQIKLMC